MQVSCPSCGTTYALPPQHVRPGVKARCKRCGLIFPAVVADSAKVAVPEPSPVPDVGQPDELPANIAAPTASPGLVARPASPDRPDGLSVPEATPGLALPASAAAGPDPSAPIDPDPDPSGIDLDAPDPSGFDLDAPEPSVDPAPGPSGFDLDAPEPFDPDPGPLGVERDAPAPPPAEPASGVVPASETFDPFADLGDLDKGEDAWGGVQADEGAGAQPEAVALDGEDEDDPFSDIDVETAASALDSPLPEARNAPAPDPTRGAVGVSAIRAQSRRPETTPVPAPEEAPVEAPTGWRVRREDQGSILSFRDLESVRGWLLANPGIQVTLSSDGQSWRTPEEIVGNLPVRKPAGPRVAAAPKRPGPTTRPPSNRAGAGWILVMGVSTALALATSTVTAQNLELVDLSDVVPFEALGLDRFLLGANGPRPETGQLSPQARYQAAVSRGDAARLKGRLIDATIAYQLALESFEGREALEGLAGAYEDLGDSARAAEMTRRLERLRAKRPGGGSSDG